MLYAPQITLTSTRDVQLADLEYHRKRKRVQEKECNRHEENRHNRMGVVVILAGVLVDIFPVPLPPIPLSHGISPRVRDSSLVQRN